MNTTGQNLRAMRRHRDLKQITVAKLAGIHNGSLSAFEMGHRVPAAKTLRRLAHVLECTSADLAGVDYDGKKNPIRAQLNDGEAEWLRLYRNHPKESQEMVKTLVGLPTDVVRDVLAASGLLIRGWATMHEISRRKHDR